MLSAELFVGWPNVVHIIVAIEWGINLKTETPWILALWFSP